MCAALLSPNCRDAFLRLSQLPSLRDRRFYSAILLAETQECVSTTFRRTHDVNLNRHPKQLNMSSTNSTLCAQPCYCQTVEMHSCVSASCQVFATGDFIRQSCLLRRKNASLQVFVELTLIRCRRNEKLKSFNQGDIFSFAVTFPLPNRLTL